MPFTLDTFTIEPCEAMSSGTSCKINIFKKFTSLQVRQYSANFKNDLFSFVTHQNEAILVDFKLAFLISKIANMYKKIKN